MVKRDDESWRVLEARFDKFDKTCLSERPGEKWTQEQLWLAFIMKEKYNKVWNGEDWIKEVKS